MIVLNTAVAEALANFKKRVDALIEKGEDKISAILDIVREDAKYCKPIHFEGNGYSDEWVEEANDADSTARLHARRFSNATSTRTAYACSRART